MNKTVEILDTVKERDYFGKRNNRNIGLLTMYIFDVKIYS